MTEPEFEFNIDNTQIGSRLDYMELLNWGTFNNRIWRIAPNGNNSLLTGAIGSGKSTVVDALTCLIVPHHKITFNKAAGAEGKERTLSSYIRGEYKNTQNEFSDATEKRRGKAVSLRYNSGNDMTFTVILANFYNVGYSSSITLAQVFWIENENIQKLLIVSKEALKIKETFENIEDGKILKQRIKNLPNIEYVGNNFSEYCQKCRREFGMNSEKAIDLFYQTVSMKSVSSLTLFVREQMLEQADIKTQIEDLKKRFNDLSRAYETVKEARRQKDMLFPLVDFSKKYNDYKQQIEEIDNILSAIPNFFASKKIALLEIEITSCETKLNQLENQLKQLKVDLENKNRVKKQIERDIDNNGGTRLKEISREIKECECAKNTKKGKHIRYSGLLSSCDLPNANTDRTFYSNLKSAKERIEFLKEIQNKNAEKIGERTASLNIAKENIKNAETELESLRNRKNQIPLWLLDIRKQLIDDLHITEYEIPFVGELIKVKDKEKQWEGALERLLHGFGVSLLVLEKHYRKISGYINARALTDKKNHGIKLDYFLVPQNLKLQASNIETDSVVNKIEIKEDSYFKDWLKMDLERHFNLRCVTIEEFQKINQDAITKEGQYKKGKRHTKDDRTNLWDRAKFILGWSNMEKIKAIEQDLGSNLYPIKQSIEEELTALINQNNNDSTLNNNLNQLIAFQDWNELNWNEEGIKIEELKREESNILTSNDKLKLANEKLAEIEEEITQLEINRDNRNKNTGEIETKIKSYNGEIIKCKEIMNIILKEESEIYYQKINKFIENENIILTFKNIDKICEDLKTKYNGTNGEKDKLNKKLSNLRSEIEKNMYSYKKEFPADTQELSVEIDSLSEFIKKYEKIINEGLPEHENKFREMLKQNTIEDIRAFDMSLEAHSKQIKNKKREINKHLREIEFNRGTYIKLLDDNNSDKEINDFKNDLRNCYANIFDNTDAYTEIRFNMVKKFLDRFMSNENKDIEWTKKVTDVRNWFLFSASELSLEDDSEKEHYYDSGGKSGGQKEKLAYTILASALAYQFGLVHGAPKSKSFRFVVIDEAFGRGDDESTQFGLELFKKLNLQLLVVTPLQKIHIIENYINSLHIVSNSEGKNSEIQYLTIEEYKQGKQKYNVKIIE